MQFTVRELEKDLGRGDMTSKVCFSKSKSISAYIVAKETGILAGRQEIEFFLGQYRVIHFRFLKRDGDFLKKGDQILLLRGTVHALMKTERIILNLLGRMSGVATFTNRIVSRTKKINPNVLITPTRKTLWGLLDKRACSLGGAGTHRLNLDSAILIKHNHIRASGFPLGKFLNKVMLSLRAQPRMGLWSKHGFAKPKFIEVEVGNIRDAKIAAKYPVVLLLDNMKPRAIRRTLASIPKHAKVLYFEASGGINPENLKSYLKTGVDVISMGCLTHSAPMFDFSMRID